MIILGIETSCDDTAVALVEDGHKLLHTTASSQLHSNTGGVIPERASRMHIEVLPVLVADIISRMNGEKPDRIAVTTNPGLIPALLVGVSFAYGLARSWDLEVIDINHLYSHVYANIFEHPDIEFPHISLLVSGGHTQIIKVKSPTEMEVIGSTLDDACGEAFDKVARMFNLGYPGGPIVSKLAMKGNREAINFPRPMENSKDYNFSFSGIKTAVSNYIKNNKDSLSVEDTLASFEYACVDILIRKTIRAARDFKINTITLSGGVAANKALREELLSYNNEFNIYVPDISICGDNAITVAGLAFYY
jgi:N6-L-threonylcarbamoyladenine synthase